MEPVFISPRQAAREFGVGLNSLRNLIHQGRCPGFWCGSHYKIDRERLLEMFRESYSGDDAKEVR